jgi:hypothetical protein
MASFCSGCGFPLAAGAGFCPNCGTRQQGAASAAPPPVQYAPAPVQYAPAPVPAPPPRSGSGLKILLVLVCFMAVLGIAAVGGLWYIGHRVKAAVVEKAKEYGVDLPKDTVSSSSRTRVRLPKPCELISKEEAATMLGEPIERMQPSEEGCLFFGPAGLALKLAQEQTSSAINKADAPGAKVAAGDMATAIDNLANAAAAGSNVPGGEQPLLMLMIDPDGKAQLTAMSIAKGIFGGIAKGSGSDMAMGAEVMGVGDRAIRMPKLGLNVLKGEVLIRIIPGPVPDADTKTIAIARTILGRI